MASTDSHYWEDHDKIGGGAEHTSPPGSSLSSSFNHLYGTTASGYDSSLEVIIEGWGGKQGFHYPTWKLRWFVLQKLPTPPESDNMKDTRDYFRTSDDAFERAHNFNVKNDKQNLILSYFTDHTKGELKEMFRFDEETCWAVQQSRTTCPKYNGALLDSLHVFCHGSRGSTKLIFIPFSGFQQPTWNMLLEPWKLAMEYALPRAHTFLHGTYFDDFYQVRDDVFGRTQLDMDKRLDAFEALLSDDEIFKDHYDVWGLLEFAPLVLFGSNAQEDNKDLDSADIRERMKVQNDTLNKFENKLNEISMEKELAGSRRAWLKYKAQAMWRDVPLAYWMKIKDLDNNTANLPDHLR